MKKNQWVPTWLLYLAHARDDTWNRKPFSAVHRMVVKCGSPRLRQSLKDQQTTSINIYVRTTHGDILEAYLHWQPNTWDRRHEQEILSTEQAKYMNAAGELKRTQDHSIFMPKNTTPKIKKRREKNVIIEFKLQNPRRYLRFNYYLINSIIKTMIMFINASHLHFLHCIVHEQTKRKEEENQKWTEWFCRANLQFSAVWWICLDTVKHICEAQTRFTCVFEMAKKKNAAQQETVQRKVKCLRQPMQRRWKTSHNERCTCFVRNRVGATALNAVDQRNEKKRSSNDTTNNQMNKIPSERTVLKMKPNQFMWIGCRT